MFVDACAIVAIMAGEDSAVSYEGALAETSDAFTSPMAAWEAIIVLSRPDQLNCRYQQAEQVVVEWLAARNIALRDPASSARVLAYAVAVAERHGIGKRALSNFDCFHYAYAKAAGCALLTFDKRLRETDPVNGAGEAVTLPAVRARLPVSCKSAPACAPPWFRRALCAARNRGRR